MKRFFATVSVLTAIFTCNIYAADFPQPSVSIGGDYSTITVNGTVPEGCSEINLLLLLPGADISSVGSGDVSDKIADAVSITGINETFSVKFTVDKRFSGGEYTLLSTAVSEDGSNFENSVVFPFKGVDYLTGMIKYFNDCDSDTVFELVERYTDILFDGNAEAMAYYENNKKSVCQSVLNKKPYTAVLQIKNAACLPYALSALKSASAESDFGDVLTKYAELFGIDKDNVFNSGKQFIISYMYENREKIISEITVCDLYSEAVMLYRFNNASRAEIDGLLREYKDILKISLDSDYTSNAADTAASVCSGAPYKSVSELLEVYKKAVSEKPQGGGSTTVIPNRTSGGGGGGGAFVPPTVSDVNQEAKPEEFCDLDEVPWAKDSIYRLKSAGVIDGVDKTHFNPGDNVKREEFSKLAAAAFDIKSDSSGISFSDVDENAWYAPYTAAMSANGIITGLPDGSFGVGQSLTRQDAVVILARITEYRALKTEAVKNTPSFTDNIDSYAADSVSLLYQLGIINGTSETTFGAYEPLTRAQAAKMIDGLRELYLKEAAQLEK